MATSISYVQPVGVRACSTSGNRKPDTQRRKGASTGWLIPLFGWSAEPDYIDSGNDKSNGLPAKADARSDSDLDPRPARRTRLAPGSFTDEKARKLRMMTTETESFHDKMYHSAIASRLASDFSHLADD